MSPTQLTLREMRKRGFLCAITEHWNAFTRQRNDLWHFCDVLCVADNRVVAVQTTSYSNVPARVKKITDNEFAPQVRKAGVEILVHGWAKNKSGRWELKREVDLS